MLSKQPLLISNSSHEEQFLQRNAEELASIELFAELSAGFTIAFMEVNSDRDRKIAIKYLRNSDQFPAVQWVPITLADEDLQYFGLEVREQLQDIKLISDRRPVLLISGLERSIGAAGEYPRVLSNLNMERDSYPRILPYPIVLLLPSYAITRCARYAPDFWSWKSIEVRLQSDLPRPEISVRTTPSVTAAVPIKSVSQSRFDLLAELLAENSKPTIDRARLLNQLGDAYRSIYKNDEAEVSYRSALDIYDNFPPSLDQANTYDGLAKLYNLQGKYTDALQLWQQSLEIQEEISDRRGAAASLHYLSMIYESLGDYPRALTLSQHSIEIDKEIGDRQGEAASLHQLSMIYQALGDYPQALSLSQLSIEINREIGNRQGEAGSLHVLSMIYQALGDYPQALSLSQLSIEIIREIGDRQGEATSLAQMAMIAYQQGDNARGRELRLQSAVMRGSIGDYGGLIITLWNLGATNEPDALGYLAQSLWLTVYCDTNLEDAIDLISVIYQKVPAGDSLQSLLGATALHFCQTRSHPEITQLRELGSQLITAAANQQGIATPAEFDQWLIAEHLNDPKYFLPALLQELEAIIGDGWLFDNRAILQQSKEQLQHI